ncbi:MAG: hypothetical protein M1321_02910 [Candidatus Marsarchaeota archaeon]|jgi:hypothetical protein|nr:hypothetical protein [Candidatus Marsarchaeota archaeon]
MPARVYTCDSGDANELKKLMEYDPYLDKSLSEEELAALRDDAQANIIFARQDYSIKDGISLNLDTKKYYLYLSAGDEFLEKADKKLKASVKSIKRADSDTEAKVIEIVEGEREQSEQGLGAIFG